MYCVSNIISRITARQNTQFKWLTDVRQYNTGNQRGTLQTLLLRRTLNA